MASIFAVMAAVTAVAALTASEPLPPPAPEIEILAERVINCRNNANVDSRLIAATLARSAEGDAIVFDGTCLVTETIPLLGNRSYTGRSRTIRGRGLGIGLDYQRGSATSLEVTSNGNLVTDVEIDRQVGEGVTINPGVLTSASPDAVGCSPDMRKRCFPSPEYSPRS